MKTAIQLQKIKYVEFRKKKSINVRMFPVGQQQHHIQQLIYNIDFERKLNYRKYILKCEI